VVNPVNLFGPPEHTRHYGDAVYMQNDFFTFNRNKNRGSTYNLISLVYLVVWSMLDNAQSKGSYGVHLAMPRVGDARLRHIHINLVAKAIKFTSKGKVSILCDLDHIPSNDFRSETYFEVQLRKLMHEIHFANLLSNLLQPPNFMSKHTTIAERDTNAETLTL